MIRYLLRRIVYGFLILLGVNLLTFLIFFAVNTPDDMGAHRDRRQVCIRRSDRGLEARAWIR